MNLYLSDGKETMWRKKGTVNDPKHTASSVKHGGGGAMALSGKLFEFEDQGQFNLSSGKHVTIFYSFWRAVLNEKNMIFRQNKKNIHIFILFKSFHAPALNAWFLFLEH